MPADPFLLPNAQALCCDGQTVLVVEDSRHASDALRLMLRHLGARMRRAGTLAEASRHLTLYRPDTVMIDLGLPDGPGERLIAALALDPRRPKRILALSALTDRGPAALACGADAFLEKPVAGLSALAAAVAPDHVVPALPEDRAPRADARSLSDDLASMADLLRSGPDLPTRRYAADFLTGLAQQTGDSPLAMVAAQLPQGSDTGLLLRMIADRRAALPRL